MTKAERVGGIKGSAKPGWLLLLGGESQETGHGSRPGGGLPPPLQGGAVLLLTFYCYSLQLYALTSL